MILIGKKLLKALAAKLEEKKYNEETLFQAFYSIIKENDSNPKEFFKYCYNVLVNKEKGPKLATFILQIGQERVVKILKQI